jgi:hypothetical protein
MEGLRIRRNVWCAHNFPDTDNGGDTGQHPALASVMGVVEEFGELTHALLKEWQGVRGTPEEHQANARDAIGDMTVYMWGIATHFDVKYDEEFWRQCTMDLRWHRSEEATNWFEEWPRLGKAVGLLQTNWDNCGPSKQRFPAEVIMTRLVYAMIRFCHSRGWSYAEIVHTTWNAVEQRDWVKYPFDGLTS